MFGFPPARHSAQPPVVRTAPATFEPLEGRQLLSASDLGLRVLKSTLPDGAVTGTTVKGAVTVQVANQSTAKISGPETLILFGSTDGTIDANSVVLGRLAKPNLKLGASGLTKVTIPVKTDVTTSGAYQLFLQASDATSVSTPPAASGSLEVATAQVNLEATALTVSGKTANFLVNHAVTFKVTLVNNGNINTSSPLSGVLELSTDGTDPITPPLTAAPQNRKVILKPNGKPVTLTYSVKVTDTGTFFIGGTFSTTDAGTNSTVKFSSTPIHVISNVA